MLTGDHHRRDLGLRPGELVEQLEPRIGRKADVAEHDAKRRSSSSCAALRRLARRDAFVAGSGDEAQEELASRSVIVDAEHRSAITQSPGVVVERWPHGARELLRRERLLQQLGRRSCAAREPVRVAGHEQQRGSRAG